MNSKIKFLIFALSFSSNVLGQTIITKDSTLITSFEAIFESFIGKEFKSFNEKDFKGINYSNTDFLGKITLVNFWFSSCPPCITEFNSLNRIVAKFSLCSRFQLISFTFDSEESIRKSIDQYQISYPVIQVEHDKSHELNFRQGFPTNILIDSTGKIVFFMAGGPVGGKEAEDYIYNLFEPKISKMIN